MILLVSLVPVTASVVGAARIPVVPEQRLPRIERRGLEGTIEVAGAPAAGWTVELYAASPAGATRLAEAVSGSGGRFRFDPPPADGRVLYLLARRGARDRLLAVLGPAGDAPRTVVVNERSTIASIWTSAQLLDGDELSGNAVGLAIAARNVPNLVDLATGGPGPVLSNHVNAARSTAFALFNTLASLLSDCLTAGCPAFFALARAPGAALPDDTIDAFREVARNPWRNVVEIFALRPPADVADPASYPAFLPTLLWPPTA